jgi:hypothetical protein
MQEKQIPAPAAFKAAIERNSRGSLESVFGEKVDVLLAGGDRVAQFYSPAFEWLLSSFNLSSVPVQHRPEIEQLTRELAFYGLYTRCLLSDYPYRLDFSRVDGDRLMSEWRVETLTANSFLSAANKENNKWPSAIFALFYKPIEEIQKRLGLGWWRRLKNKNKFKNIYASGYLLGAMHDCTTQGQKRFWGR